MWLRLFLKSLSRIALLGVLSVPSFLHAIGPKVNSEVETLYVNLGWDAEAKQVSYTCRKVPVSEKELKAQFKAVNEDTPVMITVAGNEVPHRAIKQVMDWASGAGLFKIHIVGVLKREE